MSDIQPCKCGSRRFKVTATYAATDYIELHEDSSDFDVIDTDYGDGEWDEGSIVTCLECNTVMSYHDWTNQDEPEEVAS